MSTDNQEAYLSCERGLNYFFISLNIPPYGGTMLRLCNYMPFNTIQPIQKRLSIANLKLYIIFNLKL